MNSTYTPPEVYSGKLELTTGHSSNSVLRHRRPQKAPDLRKEVLTHQKHKVMPDMLLDYIHVSNIKI